MAFWTVLTAVPVLTGISFLLAAKLEVEDIDVFELKFLTYILNWLAFWFAYQFIPYTRVRIKAAFIGAIVGGLLWEFAKGGFNWYISNMTSFDKIYGSLGAVPVFLLWIYLTWLIVLFGAEVAYAVQYPEEKSRLTADDLSNYLEFYSVRTMAEIVRRFGEGDDESASTVDSLRDIGIPSEMLGEVLNRLAEKHLIVYTEDKDYVPARQPSGIMVREVIEAVAGKKMLAPEAAKDDVSRRVRKTFQEIAKGMDSALDKLSLETLIDGSDD
jgi:membrane protein